MSHPPTSPLVAVAWISQRVPGFTAAMVATRLPRDSAAWAESGFIQATPVAGTPDVDLDTRHPLVQIDAWAMTPGSTKPPIFKAATLAERVRNATTDGALFSKPVTLPGDYGGAIVLSAYPMTEPTVVDGDPSGYARVTFDLALDWARV